MRVSQRVETTIGSAPRSELRVKRWFTTEGVDPYEAASRVQDLLSHIETSYALTARIQQLSLLRFLG
jgi:flagellar hook-associated protein 3 FlgL